MLFYKDAYIVFLSDCVFIIDKRSQGRVNQVDALSGSVNRDLNKLEIEIRNLMQHIEILRKIRAFGLKETDNRMVLIKKLNIEFVSPSERQITLD